MSKLGHGIPTDHILRLHLVEHSPSILNAPTFHIPVNQASPHKDIKFATTLNELSMNKPAAFKFCELAYAVITWTKVNLSGVVPSYCICWKSCIAFSSCPSFTYFVSFWFHGKECNCIVPSANAAISATIQLALKPECLPCLPICEIWVPFIYLQQRSRSSLSAMHSPCAMQKCYHKNREATLTFSINILHLHNFSRLGCERTSANVWDHSRIATKKERATRLTSTRHVNSKRIDVQLPSLICDPTIAKDAKGTPSTISLFDLQGVQKNYLVVPLHRCPIPWFVSNNFRVITFWKSKPTTHTVMRRRY